MCRLKTLAILIAIIGVVGCGEKKTEIYHAPAQYTAIWEFFDGALRTKPEGLKNGLWIVDKSDFETIMKGSFLSAYEPKQSGASKSQIQDLVRNSAMFFHISGNSGHLLFVVPGIALKGGNLKFKVLTVGHNYERMRIIYLSNKGSRENGDEMKMVNGSQSYYLAKQGSIRINRETRSLTELVKTYAEPFTRQSQLPEY